MIFSKEKYLARPSLEYLREASLCSGWVDKCDGKPVIDGQLCILLGGAIGFFVAAILAAGRDEK